MSESRKPSSHVPKGGSMHHLARRFKAFGLAVAVLPVLTAAGCGGGSNHSASTSSPAAPAGTPITEGTFKTIVPDNWQTSVISGELCGPSPLLCAYTKAGEVSAVVEVHTLSHPVAEAQLRSDLGAAVKQLRGGQNVLYKSITLGGAPAMAADFYSSGKSPGSPYTYAAENYEIVRVDHGGKTYAVDLSEDADKKNSAKWLTTVGLPAFHHMLTAWQWR